MSKPTPRRSEHVQRERPRAEAVTGKVGPAGGVPGRPGTPAPRETDLPPALDPALARKYWVVILIWVAGFALMVLYEVIAAIWRG